MKHLRRVLPPKFLAPAVLLALLLGFSAIAIAIGGGGVILDAQPITTNGGLDEDEQAYVVYVLPRLSILVREMTAASDLVSTHSRNVIALNQHGNRITSITDDLETWRDAHTVPSRFAEIDILIVQGSDLALSCLDAARDAFVSFDFSGIADLIPQFDEGRTRLDQALGQLQSLAAGPDAG